MDTCNIIIEVKTTWIENNNTFERNIIEYRYNYEGKLDKIAYSTNYLTQENINKEYCDYIEKNTFEIALKNKNSYKNYEEFTDLERILFRYVKNQWELF